MTYADLKWEYNTLGDDGDPWGTSISWLFDICDSLYWHHVADVPMEWQFVPAGGRDDIDYVGELLDNTTPEILIQFGNVLCRYCRMLKRAGKDY